jgi:lysine 6-dehydrogenase
VKILLLGCGRIGRYIYDVLSTKHEVVAVGYDIVINALPGNVAYKASRPL